MNRGRETPRGRRTMSAYSAISALPAAALLDENPSV